MEGEREGGREGRGAREEREGGRGREGGEGGGERRERKDKEGKRHKNIVHTHVLVVTHKKIHFSSYHLVCQKGYIETAIATWEFKPGQEQARMISVYVYIRLVIINTS